MNRFSAVALAVVVVAALPQDSRTADSPRWAREAQNVTIVRDDWGIAHVSGRTDADAVFGMIYAQAEDDFNRIETNFINSQGRLAEAEGESAIWRDLRMKMFINPDTMKAGYAASPPWLQTLMNAWADGLNFYLASHPEVKPRVITRFEPWMALTFSEGAKDRSVETSRAFHWPEWKAFTESPRRRRKTPARRCSIASRRVRTASRLPRRTRPTTGRCCSSIRTRRSSFARSCR